MELSLTAQAKKHLKFQNSSVESKMKLHVAALRYKSKTFSLVMRLKFVANASKSSKKCLAVGAKPKITTTLSRLRVVSANIRAMQRKRVAGRSAEKLAAKKTIA